MSFLKVSVSALTVFFVSCVFLLSCGEEDDLGGISEEMSNRLTEALDFDDRTIKEGGQPESSGSSNAPETDSVTAPGELSLGQEFSIVFFSDSVDAEEIAGAVAYVEGASQYLEVDGEFDSETESMTLTGTLKEDEDLVGEEFSVLVALINNDGEVGNYFEWSLEILEEEEDGSSINDAVPLACQRFSAWSERCGEFSYSCDGDEKCYTDEESLCAYVDPEAAAETILNACLKGRDQMLENDPENADANFARFDSCTGCMVEKLGSECYFPDTINLDGVVDQSQLSWRFLAPDCEEQCYYQINDIGYDAINGLRNIIGFNLTPDDLSTSLKNVCDL